MLDRGWSRRSTVVPFGLVTVAAAGALAWALPATVRFAPEAPSHFWAVAIAALVVEAPLFGAARRDDPRVPPTLSICFTLTIFVLWGAAPAIVAQAAAAAAPVVVRHRPLGVGALLGARTMCATVVAELMITAADLRPLNIRGAGLDWLEVAQALAAAGSWLIVNHGILAVTHAAARPGGRRRAVSPTRRDLLRNTTSVLLVSPLLMVLTDWWALLAALPVLAWPGLIRDQGRERDPMGREPVTGLLNRHGLTVGMRALLAVNRTTTDGPRQCGVIFINVDPVLAITNAFGREVSEKVTGEASRRLVEAYGEDCVGQLSGENFVLLMPDVSEDEAMAAAGKVVDLLTPPIEVDHIPFLLDPVAGVALSPRHGREIGTLLMKSGLAAGSARRRGQRAVLYVRQAAATARRIELLSQLHLTLRDAVRRDEIAVHYQPQVALATGRLVGVEALLRWTHPRLGPIPTNEVIQMVEPSQIMRMLTRHVVQTVVAQLKRWADDGHGLRAAVNVSVQDLHDPEFVPELHTALTSLGVQPRQLLIEMTERMPLTDPRTAQAAFALRELGVGLSLDDFGTGHASLQQLRQLPLTEVKVDRSYVSKIVTSPADLAIVTSVHQLASTLGVTVVAEGVEDRATARALARFAGTIGQGYYFGRPMSAPGLEQWAMTRASRYRSGWSSE